MNNIPLDDDMLLDIYFINKKSNTSLEEDNVRH